MSREFYQFYGPNTVAGRPLGLPGVTGSSACVPARPRVIVTRMAVTAGVLAALLLNSGCALLRDATDLLAYKACQHVDEARERHRNRQWAEEAWSQVCDSAR